PSSTYSWLDNIFKHHTELKKITSHGFRHTHASLLFEAGASLKDVQERLGHADIQTTSNIYTHVTQEKKDSTASLFSDFMLK
ncbi:TPA: tyrosine-type recombinase/integrase, partial [Listeria monocytogenes]|nr:tyrosine-type recombinase/integrase [Listeria monocytogenes]